MLELHTLGALAGGIRRNGRLAGRARGRIRGRLVVGIAVAADSDHAVGIGVGIEGSLPCYPRLAMAAASFVIDQATGTGFKPLVARILKVGLSRAGAREQPGIIAVHPEADAKS